VELDEELDPEPLFPYYVQSPEYPIPAIMTNHFGGMGGSSGSLYCEFIQKLVEKMSGGY
jgi:hypothetical protein